MKNKIAFFLRSRVFEADAMYYKLKSRYLMVLNHFKSPEKPGKSTLFFRLKTYQRMFSYGTWRSERASRGR